MIVHEPSSAACTTCEPVDIELTILMPCLNEARTLGVCITKALRSLDHLGIQGEVVVADNGSSDDSVGIASACGARVVHATRRGYGNALKAGLDSSCGRFIIMADSDDSYDFGSLEPFLTRLRAGDDLVVGNRFLGGIRPGAMPPLHHYVGNPLLTGVLNLLFHSPVSDAHCGLRGIRRGAYDRLGLEAPGMEFASEMIIKACIADMRISEVPVVLSPDGRGRPPHLRTFRDGWRHLRLMIDLRLAARNQSQGTVPMSGKQITTSS